MDWDWEWILNRFSMVTIIFTGIILIYEGVVYISMKRDDPTLPTKVYVAAWLSIGLGIAELAFGLLHLWL